MFQSFKEEKKELLKKPENTKQIKIVSARSGCERNVWGSRVFWR